MSRYHIVRSLDELQDVIRKGGPLDIAAIHKPGDIPDNPHKPMLNAQLDWAVEVRETVKPPEA